MSASKSAAPRRGLARIGRAWFEQYAETSRRLTSKCPELLGRVVAQLTEVPSMPVDAATAARESFARIAGDALGDAGKKAAALGALVATLRAENSDLRAMLAGVQRSHAAFIENVRRMRDLSDEESWQLSLRSLGVREAIDLSRAIERNLTQSATPEAGS